MNKISIIIAFLCIANLLNSFIASTMVANVLSYLSMGVLLICIYYTKRVTKYMGITLVSLGLLFNFLNKDMTVFDLGGLLTNLPLLTLILFVPLISIPLRSSGLLESPYYFIDRWKNNEKKTFFSITAFLALLSPILNLGSVRIMNDIIQDIHLHPKLQANASFVGFATAMVWSPYFGSIALVLFYTGLQISDYILIGLTYAFLILIAGNVLYRKQSGVGKILETETEEESMTLLSSHKKNILILVGVLTSLIGLLLLLEKVTGESMLLLVSMIAFIFPLLAGIIRRNLRKTLKEMIQYTKKIPDQMNSEIVLFLSAGFFGAALAGSELSKGLQQIMVSISESSFFLLILFITGLIALLSFIGVHQIISIPVIAAQISPELLGTTPEILALLFIMAWSVSSIISPFAAINMIISQAAKTDSLTVGLRWNGLFALVTFSIGVSMIYLLSIFTQ
ncbi:hypothetical protein ACOI1C_11980 [Bacillus sp. DJP31]|uniref:hypothetical protein n=1 Tax=Bacillus sp. DJP31 TaxID=3409789 RepID=UPI003BB56AA7